jgi:glyoxylase-like metal-dependent hydrolase (beta-lactamase superfamily II)
MDAVFTADAAGIYTSSTDEVHVTSPPPNFDLHQAVADAELLADIDPSWLCYGHFGPARQADRLTGYVETLEAWVANVRAMRADEPDDKAVVEAFQAALETPEVWSDRKAAAEISMNVRGVLTMLDGEDG